MGKPELGTKRVCVSCSTRFFDFTRTPATCPKCGTEQPPEAPKMRSKAGNVPAVVRKPKATVPAVEPDAEIEAAADDEEEDEGGEELDDDDADEIPDEIEAQVEKDEHDR